MTEVLCSTAKNADIAHPGLTHTWDKIKGDIKLLWIEAEAVALRKQFMQSADCPWHIPGRPFVLQVAYSSKVALSLLAFASVPLCIATITFPV